MTESLRKVQVSYEIFWDLTHHINTVIIEIIYLMFSQSDNFNDVKADLKEYFYQMVKENLILI